MKQEQIEELKAEMKHINVITFNGRESLHDLCFKTGVKQKKTICIL